MNLKMQNQKASMLNPDYFNDCVVMQKAKEKRRRNEIKK